VAQFNEVYGPSGTTVTIDELVINKGYADRRYIQQTGGSSAGQIRLRDEPSDATGYTKTIASWVDGNASVTAHGYDSGVDGIAFTYTSTGTDANNIASTVAAASMVSGRTYIISTVGTTNWTSLGAVASIAGTKFDYNGVAVTGSGGITKPVYYFKYVSSSQLSVHPTFTDARNGTNRITVGVGNGGTGTQTLTDAFYNANLLSQPFNLSGYISGQNRNDINQNRFVKTNKTDAKFDYYYLIEYQYLYKLDLNKPYLLLLALVGYFLKLVLQ
jgi:hypothetical protein